MFPFEVVIQACGHVLAHLLVPLAPRADQASVEDNLPPIDSGSVQVNLQRRNNSTRTHISNEPPQYE